MAGDFQLSPAVIEALQFFEEHDEATCAACVKVAGDFLRTGINAKLYDSAAARLGVTVGQLKRATEAIMMALIDAVRYQIGPSQLTVALLDANCNQRLADQIAAVLPAVQEHIQITLAKLARSACTQFVRLEWRLCAQIASRANRVMCQPTMELKLVLLNGDKSSSHENVLILRVDAVTLRYITSQLETALTALRSREYRKLARYLQ